MSVTNNTSQSLLSQENANNEQRQDLVFQLFEKVGTFGKYQKITMIFWCLVCYLCGGITLITPFLFYQDPYVCSVKPQGQTCTQYVCGLAPDQRETYIPGHLIDSLPDKFGDYRCPQEEGQIDLAVLLMYSSSLLAYFLLAAFGDYLGRKKIIQIGLILAIGGIVGCIFSVNMVVAAVGMLVSCWGCEWIYTIGLMFITETVGEKYREKCLVVAQTFYGVGHVANAGFFFGFRNWQSVFIFCYIIPGAVTLIAITIFVVDTPMCLINELSANKARKGLFWIAKINGRKDYYVTLDEINHVKEMENVRANSQSQGQKFTFVDLFRYPSLRWITIGMIILENAILFLFYAPTLMIAQFDFDIFIGGVVVGLSSLVAYPFCYWAITRVKRKLMSLVCFTITLACSLLLLFIWHPRKQQVEADLAEDIGVLIIFFVISFIITTQYVFLEIYIFQLYPTQIRIIGTSFTMVVGSISISFSDYIIDSCQNHGFPIMAVFCILAVISIIISLRLPQTYNITPPDFIQELAEKIQEASEKSWHEKNENEGETGSSIEKQKQES